MTTLTKPNPTAELAEICATSRDIAHATERFMMHLESKPKLKKEFLENGFKRLAQDAVSAEFVSTRAVIWNNDEPAQDWERPKGPDARIAALQSFTKTTIMDMTLPGGLRLGDATCDDIAKARDHYQERSKTFGAKATFFKKVFTKLDGSSKTVSKVMTVKELEGLRNAA